MFWKRVKFNHRTRLALVSAATTGLLLIGVFSAMIAFARWDATGDRRVELDAVLRSFMPPGDSQFDLREFHSAHPEFSAAVYGPKGGKLGQVGQQPPRHILGFAETDDRISLGRSFRGEDVVIALDIGETKRGIERLELTLFLVWFPLTLLIGSVTWMTARSVFRNLDRLSAQALAMSGSNLSERLESPDAAEFGAFADKLNQLLDRVEETVKRGEQFSTDAAHEFRTPLAILRTRLETALLQPRTPEQYEETLRRSVQEIGRLTAITEALLRSARREVAPAESIDLVPLVTESLDLWEDRFKERKIALKSSRNSAKGTILPAELRVVLDNLLDNALRYAPDDSVVWLSMEKSADGVCISIEDSGPGVSSELGERIFDRFVRADDSRNRGSGGVGIGLAVCQQIVSNRGGSMFLQTPERGGARIGFRIPG